MATIVVCPNCGARFERPFITEKRSGMGITFGPLGAIKCPQCGYKAGWGAFKKEQDIPPGSLPTKKTPAASVQSTPEEERKKSLDETKYEQQP